MLKVIAFLKRRPCGTWDKAAGPEEDRALPTAAAAAAQPLLRLLRPDSSKILEARTDVPRSTGDTDIVRVV
jgi:hypothetical protein